MTTLISSHNRCSPLTRHYSIKLPIDIDAVLGMNFFLEHVVFLDFDRRQVYIAPSSIAHCQ
jgi:hypothetical protein